MSYYDQPSAICWTRSIIFIAWHSWSENSWFNCLDWAVGDNTTWQFFVVSQGSVLKTDNKSFSLIIHVQIKGRYGSHVLCRCLSQCKKLLLFFSGCLFSGDVPVFCLKTLCGLLSFILPEKYNQCTTDSRRVLTSTEFTAKPTIWKTSVDHKCLQPKEEASGIIDKLSPKYNGTRRILHQLHGILAITGWIVQDLWKSVMKSTDSCSNFKAKKRDEDSALVKQKCPYCIAIFYIRH